MSLRRIFLLVLCAGGCADISPRHGLLALPPEPHVSAQSRFDGLRDLIGRRGIRSIEELLANLPASYRSQYVAMFESRSLQGSSSADPRIILFGDDARFVMTFNGSSEQAGYRDLETMEFDPESREFRFREISFPLQPGDSFAVSEVNPQECRRCHGTPARPVWDTYPTWPGAFGERGHAPQGGVELEGLSAFVQEQHRNPRYRPLAAADALLHGADSTARAVENRYEGLVDRPSANSKFGLLLARMNMLEIDHEVTAKSGFRRYGYALLASLDPRCLDVEAFVPAPERSTYAANARQFEADTERANATQARLKENRTHGPPDGSRRPTTSESLTKFRFLVEEGLGVSTRGWTLALEKGTYDFTTERRSAGDLEVAIVAEIAKTDPEIHSRYDTRNEGDAYCEYLEKRSASAFAHEPIELVAPPGVEPGRPYGP